MITNIEKDAELFETHVTSQISFKKDNGPTDSMEVIVLDRGIFDFIHENQYYRKNNNKKLDFFFFFFFLQSSVLILFAKWHLYLPVCNPYLIINVLVVRQLSENLLS